MTVSGVENHPLEFRISRAFSIPIGKNFDMHICLHVQAIIGQGNFDSSLRMPYSGNLSNVSLSIATRATQMMSHKWNGTESENDTGRRNDDNKWKSNKQTNKRKYHTTFFKFSLDDVRVRVLSISLTEITEIQKAINYRSLGFKVMWFVVDQSMP